MKKVEYKNKSLNKAEDSGKGAAGTSFTLTNNVQCTVSGIPSWVTGIATSYAAGTRTINPVAGVYYGRLQRSATITYSASGATSKTQTHTQSGAAPIIGVHAQTIYVGAEGGYLTPASKWATNVAQFYCKCSGAVSGIAIIEFVEQKYFEAWEPPSPTGGLSTVPGDPGQESSFQVSQTVWISENQTEGQRTFYLDIGYADQSSFPVRYTFIQSGTYSEIDISQQNIYYASA